ncbi:unnamed protein product [Rotaria socialis]|uniref:Uncharacterized protein n=1 Tax=Rotaria socialis TaxID=392032 RepID=A0A818P5S3_9BILA|nr:unnamed protein product [Rotaria socialis]CAF3271056.1 unnamed protein product [Rotaria socialis]CAF3618647.1 unnamed protein product [Rotaria socialis]CAF4410018.1 unnamed protein product [Rotaria socialis]CAF4488823.1 unnamed protein product [Rotaria socialis]
MNFKSNRLSSINTNDIVLGNGILTQQFSRSTPNSHARTQLPRTPSHIQVKKLPVPPRHVSSKSNNDRTKLQELTNKKNSTRSKAHNTKRRILPDIIIVTTETTLQSGLEESNNKNLLDRNSTLNDSSTSDLETNDNTITPDLMKIPGERYKTINVETLVNEKDEKPIENQETVDLLHKIKDIASAALVGPMPLSLQACRFELPYDLKLLENMTPLDYLSKYCRLSSRRQHQFKHIFNRFRNRYYLFESSYLYSSIIVVHKENFTRSQFNQLCQLIDLGNQECELKFDTYAGILALSERIAYYSSKLHDAYGDLHTEKHALEKCDFDGLDRKLDGLNISDTMKRLLHVL